MDTSVSLENPRRIQRRRTAGWRMPESAVYVGRPSKWGNPFGVSGSTTSETAVLWYRELVDQFASGRRPCSDSDGLSVWDADILRHIREELAGKDLACWCPLDQPCHADVLLEIANSEPA